MTRRENALRILRFDRPERIVGGPPLKLLAYYGVDHQGFGDNRGHNHPVGSRWTDIWGTGWHKEQEGVMGLPEVNPLADVSALGAYHWPDPDDERICTKIYRTHEAEDLGDRFLCGRHRDTLWEKAYMLVGMENMMVYFHTEPEFAREVLHRIMDFQLGIARHYLDLGIEFAMLGDDLGTQTGPLLGNRIVGEFLLPEYRRLTSLYKERGVMINFHSCGNVDSVVDMFMDLGVDILNPLQVTANDLDDLRRRTHGRMALQGGVSSATGMAGPPEAIADEVHRRMLQLGADGGYFCGWDQGMPYPEENREALSVAIRTYGEYPLQS